MVPLRQLGVDDVVAVLAAAAASLDAHRRGLDRLDAALEIDLTDGAGEDLGSGDTGAHLVATMGAVLGASTGAATLNELAGRLEAAGPLAVGRSGQLLVAFLGGVGELCRNADTLDPRQLAMAFEAGASAIAKRLADDGVEIRPGAMPAVADALSSVALRAADEGRSLADLVIEVADGGLDALEATTWQFEPLAETGLVDAGGAGLMVVVEAFVGVVCQEDDSLPAWEFPSAEEWSGSRPPKASEPEQSDRGHRE